MLLSLPWAFPSFGGTKEVETGACMALCLTVVVTLLLGALFAHFGRGSLGALYRREAMAIVGLSWVIATVLGAIPFLLSRVQCTADNPMSVADALFESSSGFTGTGATVLTNLEDPEMVPRAILFWRSETHFLGGLGIMVLFVAILGQGSAGKALMMAELPGPEKSSDQSRIQHAAWLFVSIYLLLNIVLTGLLIVEGMSVFDALCHSFGTVATGGFSTYNDSVAHFHSPVIEMTIAVFMVLACTNFALLYALLIWKPGKLLQDVEFRTYLAVLAVATAVIVAFGFRYGDFTDITDATRLSFFQVSSIVTNTGFATQNFDRWNEVSRALLFLLMFSGGCAGSTSCSVKIIRHILFLKIIKLEIEQAWHPTVVRTLRIGGRPVEDPEIRRSVLVYMGLVLIIFITSWMVLNVLEPDETWTDLGHARHEKLMDCASGVAATLNGVGPGLGTFGAIENYYPFQAASKMLFVLLMLLGRLEIYPLLVLLIPSFWRGP